jgi:putative endopeptidase
LLRKGRGVADLGGTLLAYIAWKRAMEGKDMKEAEGFTLNAITNPHSADEYRINGVVPNMPEFAHAFACKVGQPMVRENACRVW